MGLDVVPLVERACQIDRIVLVTMNREDLFRLGLDMADIVDQLSPVRMAGEPIDGYDLEVDNNGPLPPDRNLPPSFLDTPPHRSFCLVPDKDECIPLIGSEPAQVFHDRPAVQHTAGRDDDAGIPIDHLLTEIR